MKKNNSNIKINVFDDNIVVSVPIISQGKFRCKTRNNFQEFGIGVAPKSDIISENAYMEWQIGYDCKVLDNDKETTLPNLVFIGSNGKQKNPYELSEILYYMVKINLIKKEEIDELINIINGINEFLDEKYKINSKIENNTFINNLEFYKSTITLPTFNMIDRFSNVIIEIMISKQQFATGVQPMVYLNIPISEFENGSKLIGNNSKNIPYGLFKIDGRRVELFKNLFICFGMCSKKHNHDILEILKLIKNN